ncbi:hypothetical protein RRF57_000799 [Xylaria bambusicola]|uniref:Uncharacterized protein n=1 Tax=Xylaria bambusicola TaxID=326684 RepID=A0AAN7UBD2_9PEZI
MLYERLKTEMYLEFGSVAVDGQIERIIMNEFEYKIKRQFDIYDEQKLPQGFFCLGLEDDEDKKFMNMEIIFDQ